MQPSDSSLHYLKSTLFHRVSSQNWRPLYEMCLCLLVGPVVFTTAPAEQGLTGRSQSILLALVMFWLQSPSLGTAVASAVFSHPNPICSSLHPLILFIDHEASHSLMNKFQTVHPRASVLQVVLPPYFIPSLLLPQSSQIWPSEHPMHTAPPLLSSLAPLLAQLGGIQDCLLMTCYVAVLSTLPSLFPDIL